MAAEKLTLKVGAEASLDKGLPFSFGMRYGKVSVVCACMPDEPAYSLALKCRSGRNSLGSNIYLPVTQTRVELTKGYLDAVEATPEYIRFKYVR